MTDLFAPVARHFVLPPGNVQIAFSGGRTSAFLLHQILEANGDLPDRAIVSFQNTGREMPQTLDFVEEIERRWNVKIVWLEYRPGAPWFETVSHNSASRNGEPFEMLIRKKRFLPNVRARFCTTEMKIRTAKRYLVAQGWKRWTNAVGLRADEPRRLNKPKPKDRWTVWHPLASAGIAKEDIGQFWSDQPFDLQLPNDGGKCWLGNCDGCFLKSEANIVRLGVEHPERALWWRDMETLAGTLTSGSAANFSKRYTRQEMITFAGKRGKAALSNEGELCQKDDGECTG